MRISSMVTFLLLLLVNNLSVAALGGKPMNEGTAVSSAQTQYTTKETSLPSGTHVREYILNDGRVFAVSWSGPTLPDLKQLLGEHFDTMLAESTRQPRAGRAHIGVNTADVVIYSGGHMRAFTGHAWLPKLLPQNFNTDEIR